MNAVALTVLLATAGAGPVDAAITIRIPMRDGVEINTVIYTPAGLGAARVGALLQRTPYGVASQADWGNAVAGIGWVAVVQDERGRHDSGGVFTMERSGGDDAYDTLAWITAQSWSNGRVGSFGFSANGLLSYVTALAQPRPPPALAVQYNQASCVSFKPFNFWGGAFREQLVTGWMDSNGEAAYTAVVLANEGWGPYWESITETDWSLVDWPVMALAGWYDIFGPLQINDFFAISRGGGPNARNNQTLIIEGGGHCPGGAVAWPNATWGADWAFARQTAFFSAAIGPPHAGQRALQRSAAADEAVLGRVRARTGAAPGNTVVWYLLGPGTPGSSGLVWLAGTEAEFAAYNTTRMYMRAGGALSATPPGAGDAPSAWTADPAKPVTTAGGNNIATPCGPADQRPVEAAFPTAMVRFETAPVDAAVVVHGDVYADVWVSTSAVDTDVNVKLTDVFPSGESMLIQDGVLRLRWRDGDFASTPRPVTPGEVLRVNVSVGWTSYVLNAGHALRVAVSSANFPRFSANQNNGAPVNATGKVAAVVARNTLYTDAARPSALVLPTIPLATAMAMRV